MKTIPSYRNLTTGEVAPPHQAGYDETGAGRRTPVYVAIEGWEPTVPYETTEDGFWYASPPEEAGGEVQELVKNTRVKLDMVRRELDPPGPTNLHHHSLLGALDLLCEAVERLAHGGKPGQERLGDPGLQRRHWAYLLEGELDSGISKRAREIADGLRPKGPFRAPHSSCSLKALLGELRGARGGVLYLDDVQSFAVSHLGRLFFEWYRIPHEERPLFVLGWITGDCTPPNARVREVIHDAFPSPFVVERLGGC